MSFVVAPRSFIEVGAASLVSRALRALMLTCSVMAGAVGATAVSQHGRVGWVGTADLIDLNLSRIDMRLDFLDFRSQWELLQLVENNIEVGTWHLLHRLVANHVKLIL
jgi:hypothetical protein